MSRIRIVYFGTPDFAVPPLESLIKDEHFEVALVLSQPDRPAGRKMQVQPSPVKIVANEHNIPVLTPESVRDPQVVEAIGAVNGEAGVVVAYGQIISQELMDVFPFGIVNLHGSILPRWRGAAPIQRALVAGDEETGITLQRIVPQLDAGPVLGVRRLPLSDSMNAGDVYESLKPLGCQLLAVEFMDYLRGNLSPREQDPANVTIAKKIAKEEGLVNWQESARQTLNRIRGLSQWPGVWTVVKGKRLKLIQAEVVECAEGGRPGEVAHISEDSFTVFFAEGCLRLLQVQPQSKGVMMAGDYVRGYQLKIGDQLGE